jgi:hypothetical protein
VSTVSCATLPFPQAHTVQGAGWENPLSPEGVTALTKKVRDTLGKHPTIAQ